MHSARAGPHSEGHQSLSTAGSLALGRPLTCPVLEWEAETQTARNRRCQGAFSPCLNTWGFLFCLFPIASEFKDSLDLSIFLIHILILVILYHFKWMFSCLVEWCQSDAAETKQMWAERAIVSVWKLKVREALGSPDMFSQEARTALCWCRRQFTYRTGIFQPAWVLTWLPFSDAVNMMAVCSETVWAAGDSWFLWCNWSFQGQMRCQQSTSQCSTRCPWL